MGGFGIQQYGNHIPHGIADRHMEIAPAKSRPLRMPLARDQFRELNAKNLLREARALCIWN
jgi:hypothetical protein